MELLSKLKPSKSPMDDSVLIYNWAEVLALGLEIVPIGQQHQMVIEESEDCVQFILFYFHLSNYPNPEDTWMELEFHGWGISTPNLRELRHMWIRPNEGGYVNYLPIDTYIAALNYLKRYFDGY